MVVIAAAPAAPLDPLAAANIVATAAVAAATIMPTRLIAIPMTPRPSCRTAHEYSNVIGCERLRPTATGR
jgi:hypothetical protein